MDKTANRMSQLIGAERFEEAYELGNDPLSDPASYTEVMASLNNLANELRSGGL